LFTLLFANIGKSRPKLKDLYKHITPLYPAHWKDIGIYLDMEVEQLQIIQADHPNDSSKSCKVLWEKWLEYNSDATWEKLFGAIKYVDLSSSSALTSGNYIHTCYNVII